MQRLERDEDPTGVRKGVVAGVGEGHVACAEGVVLAEDADGVSELVAAVGEVDVSERETRRCRIERGERGRMCGEE